MKVGEGGEAFFVFETTDDVPASLQTSPVVSPSSSPKPSAGAGPDTPSLQEPDDLDLDKTNHTAAKNDSKNMPGVPIRLAEQRLSSDLGMTFCGCCPHGVS